MPQIDHNATPAHTSHFRTGEFSDIAQDELEEAWKVSQQDKKGNVLLSMSNSHSTKQDLQR